MRRRLLEEIYDKMSDEEKRLFIRMSIEDRDHKEIMQALRSQNEELKVIKKAQSFWLDLGSNIAGNAIFDGAAYLLTRLFRRL